ncbi:cell wall-binding repeat-containing protein [Priestia megaterium]|nr:cell wall-binding repeat-containing protein [Priestia megaterium]
MKKLNKYLLGASLAAALLIAGCSNNEKNQHEMNHNEMEHAEQEQPDSKSVAEKASKAPAEINENAGQNLIVEHTKNTMRLNTDDPLELSVMVSQTIWPATHKESQPGSVILVPEDNWQIALAASDLIHHPNNGPVLFVGKNEFSEAVINEINRLNPVGNNEGVQIMAMGDIADSALQPLSNYKIEKINESDPAIFAQKVDEFYAKSAGDLPQSVIVVSQDQRAEAYSLPAVNWIAHMPEPVLYVTKDEVPKATKQALKERKNKANIYVLGPDSVISPEVEKQLKEYGNVTRISGDNPVSNAIAFAAFKDKDTGFGWGITDPGHGVSFISTANLNLAIPAAPFSHMGKHAPMIWLEDGKPNEDVYKFLANIKPTFKDDPTTGPYNHGFIIGSQQSISFESQGILDEKLEIVSQNGAGHSNHSGH